MKLLFASILLVVFIVGCSNVRGIPMTSCPTASPSEITQHKETTLPEESTAPTEKASVAMGIVWERPKQYSYEDYFAFERFYCGVREDLQPDLLAENIKYVPYVENGKLMIRDYENTTTFQVGSEIFADLQICGTDGFYWIYCIEANQVLFRIDPFGNKETVCVDKTAKLTAEAFHLEDYGNLAIVSVGSNDGYRIYRIHLPSMSKDLITESGEVIHLGYPVSNYQIVWYENDEKHSTPGKQWDTSDPCVAEFQTLLSSGPTTLFDGKNNWYNMATLCTFADPKEIDLRVFFGSGFKEENPWLTVDEQALFGIQDSIPVVRLQAEKMDQVLRYMFGISLNDIEADILQVSGMYNGDTKTYYLPLGYTLYPNTTIYYLQRDLIVHKVEALDNGCYKVYYLPIITSTAQSSVDLTEKVITLRKDGNAYRVLSNTEAITPQM